MSCLGILAASGQAKPARDADAAGLGGTCESSSACQEPLSCAFEAGVLEGQCSAVCNTDAACEDAFGGPALCVGADRCVRGCSATIPCPVGTGCNGFGWCERLP
ncbi:MAG: hypothetical protein OXR73_25685 [Myxococcales bacterium]|nr:hypothetical protein [Myxococcales bacterium]